MTGVGTRAEPSAGLGTRLPNASVSSSPDDGDRENPNADPHSSRDRVATDVAADARTNPQESNRRRSEQRGRVFRCHEACEAPSCNGRDRDARRVVSDNDASQGSQEHSFDDRDGGGEPSGTMAECEPDPADETAGNEQRPAFDIDGADSDGHDRRREHKPSGRFAESRLVTAGYEKRGHSQLRDRERRSFSHRQKRQQRGRRQDHAYVVAPLK